MEIRPTELPENWERWDLFEELEGREGSLTMRLVRFRYQGRVGHFLRAEMNASALSYPVPPRTALLGLVGNILGLAKDEAPRILADAAVAVRGKVPRRHYHRANVRKAFPSALPLWIKPAKTPDTHADEPGGGFVSQVVQEWLLDPDYIVYVGSPDPADWITRSGGEALCGKDSFHAVPRDRPG